MRFIMDSSSDIVLMLQHTGGVHDTRLVSSNAAAVETLGPIAKGVQLKLLLGNQVDHERITAALKVEKASSSSQKAVQSSRNVLRSTAADTSQTTIVAGTRTASSQSSARMFYRRNNLLSARSRSYLDDVVVTEDAASSSVEVNTQPFGSDRLHAPAQRTAAVVPSSTTATEDVVIPMPQAPSTRHTPAVRLPKQPHVRRCGFKCQHGVVLEADVFLHAVSDTMTIALLQPSSAVQRVPVPRQRTSGSTATGAGAGNLTSTQEWDASELLQELSTQDIGPDAESNTSEIPNGPDEAAWGESAAEEKQSAWQGSTADEQQSPPQHQLSEAATVSIVEEDEPLQCKKSELKALLTQQRVLLLEPSQDGARAAMRLLRKYGAVGTLVRDAPSAMAAYRSSVLAARMQPDRDFTCMVLNSAPPDVPGSVEALRALGFSAPIVQVAHAAQGQLPGATACIRHPTMPHKLANALVKVLNKHP